MFRNKMITPARVLHATKQIREAAFQCNGIPSAADISHLQIGLNCHSAAVLWCSICVRLGSGGVPPGSAPSCYASRYIHTYCIDCD